MIGFLSGELISRSDNGLMIGVGSKEQGVVGYLVKVPNHISYQSLQKKARVEFFIYSHIREDVFDLYGFLTQDEKDIFLMMLTVNGVGPRAALSILSSAHPTQLIEAILNQDKAFLQQIPGIGKKTVERILIDVGDKLKKRIEAGEFQGARAGLGSPVDSTASENSIIRETKEALLGLGFKDQDITPLIRELMAAEKQIERVEDGVKFALQRLG